MRLTSSQLVDYDREGYVVLGPLVEGPELEQLAVDVERFRPPVAFGGEQNQTLLVNIHLCDGSEPVRRLCTQGPQIPVLTQLIGPDVALTHNQILWKLPDGDHSRSDIPWHQDNGYGRLDPLTDVTVWMAISDTDEANGCLRIVPGSHRLGLLDHGQAEVNPFLHQADRPFDDQAVAVPLPAGHAVAFSGLTVHGSGPNATDEPRVGFYARYCEPRTRMVTDGGGWVLDDPNSWMVAGGSTP